MRIDHRTATHLGLAAALALGMGCVSAKKYSALTTQADKTGQELEQTRQTLAQTAEALDKEKKWAGELEAGLTVARSAMVESKQEAAALEASLAESRAALAETRKKGEELEATIAHAKTRNEQLEAERDRLEAAQTDLSNALSAKRGELSKMNLRLQEETATAKKSLSQTQARVSDLDRRIRELETTQDQLSAKATQIEAERDQLRLSNDELSQSLKAGQDELSDTVSRLSTEKQALEKKIAGLTKEQDEIRAKQARELEQTTATYESLLGELKAEIDEGQVKITQYEGKLTLNVAETIFFASGETSIKKGGREVLSRVGDIIRHLSDKQVRIEGHTDNVPIARSLRAKFPTNWELSTARATTVARYLQENAGVDPSLISAAGYGEYRPVASNDTTEGKARNRRIEIVLLDRDLGRAPEPPEMKPEAAE
ncbi:MAG: OmpA family protein [Elusimicrobiota bacterium]